MDDEMLADQHRLVELIEAEGWDVTDVELSAYESPWVDTDDPEATVTITARRPYDRAEDDDGSPFRVR